ncbi:hypothetical protein V6N13_142213 [Hibiscus sabdariffa]
MMKHLVVSELARVGVEAFVEVNQSSLYGDDLKVVGITSDPLIPSEGVEPGSSIIGVDTRFPLKARTNVVAKPTVVEVMLSTKANQAQSQAVEANKEAVEAGTKVRVQYSVRCPRDA